MMTQRIPSSSSFTCPWTYTVFLNFRGIDTRNGFTGYLYKALCDKGIDTFIDDEELHKGEEITPTLVKAIEESRIAIVIFSENYASSTFCLEELVKIIEMMKQKHIWVLPVFYQVDPSDVRYQKGIFGEEFHKHIEKRLKNNMDKVQKWKSTLKVAADLSGWHFYDGRAIEYKFIEQIIDEVQQKTTRIPLHVANYPVGLDSRVQEVKGLLKIESNKGVNMMGIHGIGGIGKTTIACAVYNLIADHFEGVCFLNDIRENSNTKHDLAQLQKKLLIDILGVRDIKFKNVKEGSTVIKHRLGKKKVLLILDDVNKLEQLQTLAGEPDWFGSGSKIIVTTRDKHLLDTHGVVQKYEVVRLNHKEALELFSWNAFRKDKIDPSYLDLSKDAVSYSNGLPLALEVIGSNLCKRSIEAWVSALTQYRRSPNNVIFEKLKVSYDCLDEDHQKIFLDLACFFKGALLEHVIDTFQHGRDLDPRFGLEELVGRSLIKIDTRKGTLTMHDLIQDMGREIVKQESPLSPGRRSRLWSSADIIEVLEENAGGESVEVMMVNLPPDEMVQWDGMAFENMKNLKVLIIKYADFSTEIKYLPRSLRQFEWDGYPFSALPTNFCPRNLVTLRLPNSCTILDGAIEKFKSLRDLNLSGNKFLIQVPNISGAPNLETLRLNDCLNLIEVHNSVGNHSKLRVLNAAGCTKLSIFPRHIMMKSLEFLNLLGCSSFKIFPEISGKMENIKYVTLDNSGIDSLPYSIQNLVGLQIIRLYSCKELSRLPTSILTLPKLQQLIVHRSIGVSFFCESEEDEQERFSPLMHSRNRHIYLRDCNLTNGFLLTRLPNVFAWENLHVESCDFVILSIKDFPFLKRLTLTDCKQLREIRKLPPSLMILELIKCKQLREIRELPPFLTTLTVIECEQLQEIKVRPPNIKDSYVINCTSMTSKSSSILLNMNEVCGTLPRVRIPRRFDHYIMGPSLSFWYYKRFSSVTLGMMPSIIAGPFSSIYIIVIVNGTQNSSYRLETPYGESLNISKMDYVFMIPLNELCIEPGWNHLEMFGISYDYLSKKWEFVKGMSVSAFKHENNMENVCFTNPFNPLQKRKFNDFEANDPPSVKYLVPIIRQQIWDMQALPIIKKLLWEICEKRAELPTYGILSKRKIIDDPLCPICGEKDETVEHVFLLCPWTRPIWFGSEFQWTVDNNSMDGIDHWLCKSFYKIQEVHLNSNQKNALVGCICWAIWNEREDFVSGGQPVCPKRALDRAKKMHKQCLEQTIFPKPWLTYKFCGEEEQIRKKYRR